MTRRSCTSTPSTMRASLEAPCSSIPMGSQVRFMWPASYQSSRSSLSPLSMRSAMRRA
ncbi:hypothetical protein [Lysobacter gummosus]|uniref:hypothetical protein n=1 Tax=Lysobacter gummosus TaxID=262324 RepID=UPI00363ED138